MIPFNYRMIFKNAPNILQVYDLATKLLLWTFQMPNLLLWNHIYGLDAMVQLNPLSGIQHPRQEQSLRQEQFPRQEAAHLQSSQPPPRNVPELPRLRSRRQEAAHLSQSFQPSLKAAHHQNHEEPPQSAQRLRSRRPVLQPSSSSSQASPIEVGNFNRRRKLTEGEGSKTKASIDE